MIRTWKSATLIGTVVVGVACSGAGRSSDTAPPTALEPEVTPSAPAPTPPPSASASGESGTTAESGASCADAHVAPGGCKGGYLVPDRQLCFLQIESACRCACDGKVVKQCEAPAADPGTPPGPIIPEVDCE